MDVQHCNAEVWLGPVSGTIRCHLEHGHLCRWHRNEMAGWEWDDGQLWLLLPARAA